MLIYVAGPMDQAGYVPGLVTLREVVHEALFSAGATTYDPTRPFTRPGDSPDAVYSINEHALDQAHGLLALLPKGIPSIGTPMEIQSAARRGIPVAVVTDSWSMQLEAMNVRIFPEDEARAAADWIATWATYVESGRDLTIRWIGEEECEPRCGYDGDAGFDLIVSQDVKIPVGGFYDVPHGVCVQLPPRVWALITGRSSTIRKRGILVTNGIIDNGYRGPLFAAVQNVGDSVATIERGDRIAQLIPFNLTSADLRLLRVPDLDPSDRGDRGFGSSGV